MPTLRILADGQRPVYATPGAPDGARIPSFAVGGGDTVSCALDCTGFLGAATISDSVWTVDGGTLGATAIDGATATAAITVPAMALPAPWLDGVCALAVTVRHTLTASDGRVRHTTFRLYPEPR